MKNLLLRACIVALAFLAVPASGQSRAPVYLDSAGHPVGAQGTFCVPTATLSCPSGSSLPATLGPKTSANSLSITPATDATFSTRAAPAATAARSDVTAAAADTIILAANANRMPGSVILNDSSAVMYILLCPTTCVASATNYTFAIDAKSTVSGFYTLGNWTGAVHAYWASATGSARVTEITQ